MFVFSNRRGLCFRPAPVTAVFPMVAPPVPERDGVECSESLSLPRVDHALRRRNAVSKFVIAIGICHVLRPDALHFDSLRPRDAGGDGFRFLRVVALGELLDGINRTAVEDEVGEFGDVGSIFVIDSVFPTICGPI